MANDLNTPSFNLGDEDDFNQFPVPPREEKPTDTSKSKPKLMFEDAPMENQAGEDLETPKPKKSKGKSGKGAEKSEKGGSKKWLFLLIALIVIIAGGIYFLNSQGYLNLGKVGESVVKLKNSIFGGGKSDSVEVVDDEAEDGHKSDSAKKALKSETKEAGKKEGEEVKKAGEEGHKEQAKETAEHKETPKKEEAKENKETRAHETKIEAKKAEHEVKKPEHETKKPIKEIKKTEIKKQEAKKETKQNAKENKPQKGLKKSEKSVASKADSKGNYSIQVASVKNKSKAEHESARVRKLGFTSFVKAVKIENLGGWWYRVMIGPYKTQESAESQLLKIKSKLNVEGIIREK